MPRRPDSLPSDPAELKTIVLDLQAENAELRVYAGLLRQMIFGAKSEKLAVLDPAQIALDLGDLSEVPVAANDDAAAEDEDRPRRKRTKVCQLWAQTDQHISDIRQAIEALLVARRDEVAQIANNASNAAAREKLVSIQMTIEALERALEHEQRYARCASATRHQTLNRVGPAPTFRA